MVDLTNRCNNNCLACWTNSPLLRDAAPGPDWSSHQLPEPLVLGLLADLAKLQTQHVRFTGGGEPFQHPSILPVLECAAGHGLRTAVTTNFTLVREPHLALLLGLPVAELAVSLWAASGRTYSRLHPNKTARTFERILEGLRVLLKSRQAGKPRVTLCHVLNAINFGEFDAMVDQAQQLGVDALYFTLVDPVPGYTEGLLLRPPQQQRLLERATALLESERRRQPGFPLLENFDNFLARLQQNDPVRGLYDLHHIDSVPCYVGWIFARVLADGQVVPCCRGVELPLGNLHHQRFRDIWFSGDYDHFRHMALTCSKRDPYFASIGCGATCDNLMHNQQFHDRAQAPWPTEHS